MYHQQLKIRPQLMIFLFASICLSVACQPNTKKNRQENTTLPSRIVSLSPILTEILFELGEEKHLIGVTRYCDRPKRAQQKKIVAGFNDIQIEQILTIKPDLIVASQSASQQNALRIFEDKKIHVWRANSNHLKDIYENIRSLSQLTGHQIKGEKLILNMQNSILKSAQALSIKSDLLKNETPKVLVLIGHSPFVGAGEESYPMEVLKSIGFIPALQKNKSDWPVLSIESIVSLNADYVILAEGEQAKASFEKQLNQVPFISSKMIRPKVLVPKNAILMRPSISLTDDIKILSDLFIF